jgi:hypothetical protein
MTPAPGTPNGTGPGTPNAPGVRMELATVVCVLRPVDVPAFAPA